MVCSSINSLITRRTRGSDIAYAVANGEFVHSICIASSSS